MDPLELNAIRQLIRASNGLPEPPRPRWSDPLTPARPVVAAPAQANTERATPELAAPDRAALAEPDLRQDSTDADAAGTAEEAPAAWRPDALVHRLVELLMDMRALSEVAPAPLSSLPEAA